MQQLDFHTLLVKLSHLSEGEISDVREAFDFAVSAHAHQTREDGSPYVLHVIAVAETLAGWKADRDTVISALLHDVIEDTKIRKDEIAEKFGRRVALLVESVTKFTQADLSPDLPLDRKIETLRKLFDVMRYDMRSILIKLADRLHNVLTIDALPTADRQRRFALETLSIYHKIALHLGMRDVRHVFAEHCVPAAYDDGIGALAERDRSYEDASHLRGVIERDFLHTQASTTVLSVRIEPRNLLTFYERRKARGGVSVPLDAFIVSISVATEDECYRMLRLLHTLYRPVSGQFRDYIAAPSDAGYQSLHTIVTLTDGRAVEVRIRTPEMHDQAMRGITLWLFSGQRVPPTFTWLKRTESLDLKTRESSSAFWEALQTDVLSETISVIVDKRRMSIPKGSTILDAGYAAYDDRAGFVRSATIGGVQQALATILKEDQDVHLTFDSKEQVGFEWLQMISTQHARMHIVDVLKMTSKIDKQTLGASLLQKELDHYSRGHLSELSKHQCQQCAKHFRRETFSDVLSMIGEGVIRARDVVFFLFPDQESRFFSGRQRGRYSFRLHIVATEHAGQDVLSLLHGVIRTTDVVVAKSVIRSRAQKGIVDIVLVGSADDRLQFADFVDLLERQEWTSTVETMISRPQKFFLVLSSFVALLVVALDIAFIPSFQAFVDRQTVLPSVLLQAVPLLPILVVNYLLLHLLRHYIVRMRTERWFLGMGLLLNVIGLVLLIVRIFMVGIEHGSLLPLIAVFTISLLYMGYRFFQADMLFSPTAVNGDVEPQQAKSVRYITREKVIGYAIRLCAVVVWGFIPIYIRYTPVATLPPLLRLFLMGLGVFVPFTVLHIVRSLLMSRRFPSFRLPYNWAFAFLVVGQTAYAYFENVTLLYTSGTNLLLFNNFTPVIGLFIAVLFWRRDIPYLRKSQTMLWVFLLAVLSGLGSALLIYAHSAHEVSNGNLALGDLFAVISTFFDVMLTVGLIQYIRRLPRTDGVLLNIHLFFYFLIISAPILFVSDVIGFAPLPLFSFDLWIRGAGIGLLIGIGLLLNYEAFKRVDGYIAYLLFNLSVVVTFAFEALIFHSVSLTIQLLLSAGLILGAASFAEYINSRSQLASDAHTS